MSGWLGSRPGTTQLSWPWFPPFPPKSGVRSSPHWELGGLSTTPKAKHLNASRVEFMDAGSSSRQKPRLVCKQSLAENHILANGLLGFQNVNRLGLGERTTQGMSVYFAKRTPSRVLFSQFISFCHSFFNGSHHIEGLLWKMVIFTCQNLLESFDGLFQGYQLPHMTCEDLSNLEWLR